MTCRVVCFAFFLLTVHAAAAEPSPGDIDTDRPDQTESSALVPQRHIQLEFGALYKDDAVEVLEAPALLIRYGLIERLELRLGVPTLTTVFDDGTEADFADPELGAKIALWTEKGWRPEAALLAGTTVPVGSDDASSERFDPAFRFSFGHTLPRDFSLGYNVGVAWETEPEDDGSGRNTGARFEYTAALGYDFADRWGAFIEVFGDAPLNDAGGPAHSLDGGLTYLVRPNLQLDVAAGVGLNSEAPDWFVTAGLSVRLPR